MVAMVVLEPSWEQTLATIRVIWLLLLLLCKQLLLPCQLLPVWKLGLKLIQALEIRVAAKSHLGC